MASTLAGNSFTAPTHIAWGDGSTAFTLNDTALSSELERNAYNTRDLQSVTIQWEGVLTTAELNGSTLYETGLLNSSTAGDLFVRDTFAALDKTSQFELVTLFIMRIK